MASDVLTLFNMPSSREVGQTYMNEGMISPTQLGSQGLLQQAVSLQGNRGAMAGYGVGRLLGGQAPQEARARGIEEAMAKVQGLGLQDDSEMYAALSQELATRGLTQDALQARQAAMKARESSSKINLQEKQAQKAAAFEKNQSDTAAQRSLVASVETRLANNQPVSPEELNQVKFIAMDKGRGKQFVDASGNVITMPGIDFNEFPSVSAAIKGAGTSGGAPVAKVTETPASKAGKEKEIETINTAVTGIDDGLNAIQAIRDIRVGSLSTNPWLVDKLKEFPSAAMAQDDLIKTVTAGKVIDTIKEMKSQSKTGATGFGALNIKELDLLEAAARRLNPRSPTFEKDLAYIEQRLVQAKGVLQDSLTKKAETPTQPSWQNQAGVEGQAAILNQELQKARAAGNKADEAGLLRELDRLSGGKPAAKSALSFEQKVQKTMLANPGASRAKIEAQLRAAGHQ
jgi:hypothetical protein